MEFLLIIRIPYFSNIALMGHIKSAIVYSIFNPRANHFKEACRQWIFIDKKNVNPTLIGTIITFKTFREGFRF